MFHFILVNKEQAIYRGEWLREGLPPLYDRFRLIRGLHKN